MMEDANLEMNPKDPKELLCPRGGARALLFSWPTPSAPLARDMLKLLSVETGVAALRLRGPWPLQRAQATL